MLRIVGATSTIKLLGKPAIIAFTNRFTCLKRQFFSERGDVQQQYVVSRLVGLEVDSVRVASCCLDFLKLKSTGVETTAWC